MKSEMELVMIPQEMQSRNPGLRFAKWSTRKIKSFTNKFRTSLRLQLIMTTGVCLVAGAAVFGVSNVVCDKLFNEPEIDYTQGIDLLDQRAINLVNSIGTINGNYRVKQNNPGSYFTYDEVMSYATSYGHVTALLVDLDGKVLVASNNAIETQVDLNRLFTNVMNARTMGSNSGNPGVVTSIYPVNVQTAIIQNSKQKAIISPDKGSEIRAYAIVSGTPQAQITYRQQTNPIAIFAGIAAFILLFYWLTKRKMKQIETLAAGLQEISKGHLDYRVPEQSRDEIGSLASDINRMASELQLTIEEERLAEKTKNELITNVSHDLRTPLTSIMGYLKLLQDKKYDTPAQLDEFIQIASGKSEQLRALIEDLFEYTKLTNQGIRLHRRNIGLNELLEQLTEEFVPVAEEQNVRIVRLIPDDKVLIHADADKMVRVFENLLANAIKYSTKPGEIKVELHPEAEHVVVSVHNQGEPIPPDELPRLFERFYKMETARTSAAGGSGLGLAIAKSIVDLHDGEIWAESTGDEIRFLVRLQRVY